MRLEFLQPLLDHPGPWATVYFAPGDNDEEGAKRRELSVREICRTLVDEGADAATLRAVHDALGGVRPAQDPAGRVFFAAGGEVVLSRRLARPPQRQMVAWGALPRLTPLLELCGQDPVCLVAYIDRTGAYFELRGAAGPQDAGQVEGRQWPIHRTATSDWSERHFQLRVENTWEHNAGEIAEALTEAYGESGADLVVLVGDVRERRSVHERLPDTVREVAVETEHGGRAAGSSSPALEAAIAQAGQEHARRRVERALDRFRAGRGGTGNEPEAVEAAREHRIGTLLVRADGPDLGRDTWVGADPDQVAVRRTEARALGESEPVSVRADDALLRSAAATAAEVLMVPSPGADGAARDSDASERAGAAIPEGGLGALLRWTHEPTPV